MLTLPELRNIILKDKQKQMGPMAQNIAMNMGYLEKSIFKHYLSWNLASWERANSFFQQKKSKDIW